MISLFLIALLAAGAALGVASPAPNANEHSANIPTVRRSKLGSRNSLFTPWINLDRSEQRRNRMQNMFDDIEKKFPGELKPMRISAVDDTKVERLIKAGKLRTPGSTLLNMFAANRQNWEHHFSGEYLKTEAGCTLSHLFAIKEAYELGHDVALVIEDDAIVSDKFMTNWKEFVSRAPSDWQILQLYSNSNAVMKLSSRIEDDGFTPWMPDHYGTAAYLINRAGMRALLDVFFSSTMGWSFPEKMVVADEFLYFYTTSYTALDPMVYLLGSNSTIQKDSSDELNGRVAMSERAYMSKLSKPFIKRTITEPLPKILVITTTKINFMNQTKSSVDLFYTNVGILSTHAKIRYELLILLRLEEFKQPVIDAIKPYLLTYGDRTNIHFKTEQDRFNKFRFVKMHIEEMRRHEYVLLVDSDILFMGYPWAEFLKQHKEAKAVVTGTIRESKSEGLIRNIHPGVRQWFKVFDGSWWKHPLNQDVKYIYIDFLEQYFSLLNGNFAYWFFNQILTNKILYSESGKPSESDFGPDVMWCGAAADWIDLNSFPSTEFRQPCALIPLVISHADTRQIAYSGGEVDKSHLRKQIEMFPQWASYSYKFRSILGGKRWNSVNMSTILYEYKKFGFEELAMMGMVPRRGPRVAKHARRNPQPNASDVKKPPEIILKRARRKNVPHSAPATKESSKPPAAKVSVRRISKSRKSWAVRGSKR